MVWVLVIFYIGSATGETNTSLRFETEAACLEAKAKLIDLIPPKENEKPKLPRPAINAACVGSVIK